MRGNGKRKREREKAKATPLVPVETRPSMNEPGGPAFVHGPLAIDDQLAEDFEQAEYGRANGYCPECDPDWKHRDKHAEGCTRGAAPHKVVRAAIDQVIDALPSDPEAEVAMDRAMAEKSTGTKRLLRVPVDAMPVGPAPEEPMLAAPLPPLPFEDSLRAFAEEIRPRIREAQKNDLSRYLKGTP